MVAPLCSLGLFVEGHQESFRGPLVHIGPGVEDADFIGVFALELVEAVRRDDEGLGRKDAIQIGGRAIARVGTVDAYQTFEAGPGDAFLRVCDVMGSGVPSGNVASLISAPLPLPRSP